MYDFEAVNAEQLVTRTDVVLRGDLAKRRIAARARGAAVRRELRLAGAHEDRTVFVRQDPSTRPLYVCCAVATLAWCCVAAFCLHL
jgi:hypothetical protein